MEKTVLITRGLPGGGKSTWLEKKHPNATVCSADHYFMDNEGGYNFDVSKLGEAHDQCFTKFMSHHQKRSLFPWQYQCQRDPWEPILPPDILAIDNTNTQLWEFFGYIQLARFHEYKVIVHQFNGPQRSCEGILPEKIEAYIEKCHKRCIHGVPLETMMRMHRESQKIPSHWDVEVVNHYGDDWHEEHDHEEGYDTFRKQSHDATSDNQSEVHSEEDIEHFINHNS